MGTLWQDVRYALRAMRRNRGFTAAAVLSLALGTGANTAIFSLVDTVMLRTLPVRHPEQLVELLHRFPGEPHLNGFSWTSYRYFLEHNHVFSALPGEVNAPSSRGSSFTVRAEGVEPEKVDGVFVTGDFFPALGVTPAVGRLIGPEDDRIDAPGSVAVVSWLWWKNRFNSDRSILGKRILVNDAPVTIVGVAAREFTGWRIELRENLWLPLALQARMEPQNNYLKSRGGAMTLVGRLKPGVTIDQARAEMAVLYRQTVPQRRPGGSSPFQSAMRFEMEPAGAGLSGVRDVYGRPLAALMALVGVLLLIACTNIASLLLARGTARQREMAVRVSLGAGRFRLVRQVLTESVLLSAAGTLAGIALAYAGTGVLLRIISSGRNPIDLHVAPDWRVLLFTAALALLTGVLFGLAPAWRAGSTPPASAMREVGRAADTPLRRLMAKSLVAAQVAFSVVLLTAAGLFAGRLGHLYSNLGFQRDHVLLVTLDPSQSGYKREQLAEPYRQLLERLSGLPGVRSATLSGVTPVQGPGANRDATVEGYQAAPTEMRYLVENWVAPRYFETIGTPLLAGRDLRFDDQGQPRVAIVNQAMVRYYFRDGSPLGKHVLFDGDDKPYEIVGVVGDSKYMEPGEITPRTIYFNAFQEGRLFSQLALRTTSAPEAVASEVRQTVHEMLKTIPVDHITTLADQVDAAIVPERLIVTLSGLFGALGSGLAAVGIYGLLAYTVARRVNEIGIRMALGATRTGVTAMVLWDALGTIGSGLAIGVPLAFWVKRIAGSVVPDLPAQGIAPIALGAATMIGLGLAAALLPARRAAASDPLDALRYD